MLKLDALQPHSQDPEGMIQNGMDVQPETNRDTNKVLKSEAEGQNHHIEVGSQNMLETYPNLTTPNEACSGVPAVSSGVVDQNMLETYPNQTIPEEANSEVPTSSTYALLILKMPNFRLFNKIRTTFDKKKV